MDRKKVSRVKELDKAIRGIEYSINCLEGSYLKIEGNLFVAFAEDHPIIEDLGKYRSLSDTDQKQIAVFVIDLLKLKLKKLELELKLI